MRNPEDTHDADLAICLCVERVFGGEGFKVGDKVKFIDVGAYSSTEDHVFPKGVKNHTGTIESDSGDNLFRVLVDDSNHPSSISFFAKSLKRA